MDLWMVRELLDLDAFYVLRTALPRRSSSPILHNLRDSQAIADASVG